MSGHIYILREREFIRLNENVYKIGQTGKGDIVRFKQYPKDSELITSFEVVNHKLIENIILNDFKKKFIHRKDIGNEYFEGDIDTMLGILYRICILKQEPKIASKYSLTISSDTESSMSTDKDTINELFEDCLIQFIRIKLGQDFKNPKFNKYAKPIHQRFCFNACDDYYNNKKICELFENDCNGYNIVIFTSKGTGYAYLIVNDNYIKMNYWDTKYWHNGVNGYLDLPYEYKLEISGLGTVEIIGSLINYSNLSRIDSIKEWQSEYQILEETNYLYTFLTAAHDSLFHSKDISIVFKKDAITNLDDFKRLFKEYMTRKFPTVKYKWSSDYSAFKRCGYDVIQTYICASCNNKAVKNCCNEYDAKNRRKKFIIQHMVIVGA